MKVTKKECYLCKHSYISGTHYGRITCDINNVTINELYYSCQNYDCNYYEHQN